MNILIAEMKWLKLFSLLHCLDIVASPIVGGAYSQVPSFFSGQQMFSQPGMAPQGSMYLAQQPNTEPVNQYKLFTDTTTPGTSFGDWVLFWWCFLAMAFYILLFIYLFILSFSPIHTNLQHSSLQWTFWTLCSSHPFTFLLP